MIQLSLKNSDIFYLNNVEYPRIFDVVEMGKYHIKIYNIFYSRQVIVESRRYDEVMVDGETYGDREELIDKLRAIIKRV